MSVTKTIRSIALAGCALICLSYPAHASDGLPQPTGEILLTITGETEVTNADGAVVLDRALLEGMGEVSFVTNTIWTDGEVEFSGVSLAALLRHLGIEKGTLRATAINDYAIEIPVPQSLEEPAIIAYELNGEPMSVREKGPLWLVYPYDSNPEFQSEIYYSRSIWQLDRIVVLP